MHQSKQRQAQLLLGLLDNKVERVVQRIKPLQGKKGEKGKIRAPLVGIDYY